MNILIDAHNEKMEDKVKEETAKIYSLSANIAQFVNLAFNGKSLPSYDSLYGDKEKDAQNQAMQQMMQFRCFTDSANFNIGKAE